MLTTIPSDLTSKPASDPLITSILIIDSDLILSNVLIILVDFEDCLSPFMSICVP